MNKTSPKSDNGKDISGVDTSWIKDELADQRKWINGLKDVSEHDKAIFLEGFERGWRRCVAMLRLHGVIVDK